MDAATGTILAEVSKHGILGAIILTLALVVIASVRAYMKSNEDRHTDSAKFQEKYVGLVERSIEAEAGTNTTLQVIKEKLK